MTLHVERAGPKRPGPDAGPPLVLTHGFTQNSRCWGDFAAALAVDHRLALIDGPGHGRSHHDDADLVRSAELTAEVGGSGIYVGYSMGGRVALHAALQPATPVVGLVLIGATAGLEDATERADRRAADEALAVRLLDEGLPTFIDRWLDLPLFAGLSEEQAAKAQRLTNRPQGLAASLRNCGTGTQEPLWSSLASLSMPVLVVTGEQDDKFRAIGQRMVSAMTGSDAELASVPGTHAVHLERPKETAALISRWISRRFQRGSATYSSS